MTDAPASPPLYRDETGMAQLCLAMLAGMIGAAALAAAGAGWWSVFAVPDHGKDSCAILTHRRCTAE